MAPTHRCRVRRLRGRLRGVPPEAGTQTKFEVQGAIMESDKHIEGWDGIAAEGWDLITGEGWDD